MSIHEHLKRGGARRSTPDPASLRLQILTTEHWSLLATRSLTYSESLSRVVMFLSVLSGTIVALALLAQVDHLRETLPVITLLMLSVVLLIGIATVLRLAELNCEDLRAVLGMNRLRRGYLAMHPDLEPYFLTGSHDDLRGLMVTLDMDMVPGRWSAREVAHGFQTLPATLSAIVAVVAGVLAALLAVWFGAPSPLTVALAAGTFLACMVVLGLLTRHAFISFVGRMPTQFPSAPPPQQLPTRTAQETGDGHEGHPGEGHPEHARVNGRSAPSTTAALP